MTCECEFDLDPNDIEDDWHYRRTCPSCSVVWWALHCPHDGWQNPCPSCGQCPAPVLDREGRVHGSCTHGAPACYECVAYDTILANST